MSHEDELTPADRELETALRSLRPQAAHINPAAAVLAARRARLPQVRRWLPAAAVAAIAVASGAWLSLTPPGQQPDRAERHAPTIESDSAAVIKSRLDSPTLLDYRRALARSAAEFEELLDRQALVSGTPAQQAAPGGVLTLWNANLDPFLGEM